MLLQHMCFALTAGASLVAGRGIVRRSGPGGCTVPEWSDPFIVGGGAENVAIVCESAWPKPDFISRITTYDNGNTITGIKFQYRSGTVASHGEGFISNEKTITLANDELVTRARMSGNGVGTRLGRIHLETNKGQNVVLGGNREARWWDIDHGTGIIVGASIGAGAELDQMALFFLGGKVEKVRISNIVYAEDPALSGPPLQVLTLDQLHFYNKDLSNTTFTFEGKDTRATEITATSSTTGSFGMSFEWGVEGGLPILGGEFKTTVSWHVEHTELKSTTKKDSIDLAWRLSSTLGPGEGATCTALVRRGEGDFPYSSTVTFELGNGKSYSFEEPGVLRSVQYTEVNTSCQRNDLEFVQGVKDGSVDSAANTAATLDAPQ